MFFTAFALLAVLFFGCSKSESPCFSSYGDDVLEVREIPQFSEVEVQGEIELKIVPAEVQRIEISYGENLTEYITTQTESGRLIIKNEVKCIWLRDLSKKPKVTIYTNFLKYLYKEGAGDLLFEDTLRGSDFFYEQRNLAGVVSILYSGQKIKLALHTGYTTCTVAGKAEEVELYCNTVGSLDARALKTSYCEVNNSSISDMYVYSSGYLFADIRSGGDVYYTGEPTFAEANITGTGFFLPF